mgnify:CR=1 FL=1
MSMWLCQNQILIEKHSIHSRNNSLRVAKKCSNRMSKRDKCITFLEYGSFDSQDDDVNQLYDTNSIVELFSNVLSILARLGYMG